MKLTIDTALQTLVREDGASAKSLPLYSDEAFEVLSDLWVKVGWNQKYSYTFTWLGRPIIQLPEDLVRIQEAIWEVKPDVIIETGVAHGGSLILYASLCKAIGRGRVIGIDIEIRPDNRAAIEGHNLASFITLIEGSSVERSTADRVRALVGPGERVLVVLDSSHTRDHVLRELETYGPLVSRGSYIVATDGIMKNLADVPRGLRDWASDNPASAAIAYADAHPEFALEPPVRLFRESGLSRPVTYWPDAYLRRT